MKKENVRPSRPVWFIDDDKLYLFSMRTMVAHYNLFENVQDFTSAANALELLKTFTPDEEALLPEIIFLDVNMPEMNGWMFIEAFIHLPFFIQRHTSIVLVSSSKDEYDLAKSIALPMVQAYLVKPVTITQIRQVLQQITVGFK